MNNDILSLADIKILVDEFYARIRQDEILADIFNNAIQDRWPEHLERMYTFWQTVLLDEHTYNGAPFMKHRNLPVSAEHFNRWLQLFFATVDDLYSGQIANEAKMRGQKMAEMFHYKIEYAREQNQKPLI